MRRLWKRDNRSKNPSSSKSSSAPLFFCKQHQQPQWPILIQYCLLKFLLLPSASHSKLTSFNFLTANSSLPLSALLLLDLSVDMRVSMCQCMFACVVNYVCRELLMCYYMYVMWCIYCLCLCMYVCIYV
jgi:hypothetical protein